MEDRWINKNVDLSMLKSCLIRFFEEKSFKISGEGSREKHCIVALPTRIHDISEEIRVHVDGRPDDFRVRFKAGSRSSELVRLGILTTAFGGGRLTVKGLKSQEALERLEKEFWVYLDEVIWSLARRASGSSKRQ